MSILARKDLKLAETPSRPDLTDAPRSAPGVRYREARIQIPKEVKCNLKWRDYYGQELTAQVQDLSRYGCRVILPKALDGQKLYVRIHRAQIEIDSIVAYTGGISFVNERQEPDGTITIGATLEQAGCDLDTLSAAARVRTISIENDLHRILTISESVSDSFKILVAELNVILQEIMQKLEVEEGHLAETAQSENHKTRLEERVISVAMSIYRPHLQSLLTKFQSLVQDMTLDEEISHKQYFRLNFQSLVKGTPFVERGLSKPLGYSGDYGMMVMLYEYADQGRTLFNRFFHRFVCSEPAAVANRNRVGFLSDILLAGYDKAVKNGAKHFHVASLACGPAREIYEFLKYAPLTPEVPVKIVLLDSEDHALDYAQTRLKEIITPERYAELIFLKEDVVTGALQGREFLKWIENSDYVISAGLFDYLTDRVSQRMISSLYSYLKPGGELLIGNISKKSPDVFAMDYFMDWRLILRDSPDLLKLVAEDLVKHEKAEADVISESLGLNLFLRVRRGKKS